MTKICLIAAFPPSIGPLSEYSYHIARELQRHKNVELTILADELEDDELATGTPGASDHRPCSQELPGVTVIRCWKFGSLATPFRLINMIRQLKPDVVWYNLVFSSFGAPDNPVAAFAGLTAPALTRAAGFYTHITLHHIVDTSTFPATESPARNCIAWVPIWRRVLFCEPIRCQSCCRITGVRS